MGGEWVVNAIFIIKAFGDICDGTGADRTEVELPWRPFATFKMLASGSERVQ